MQVMTSEEWHVKGKALYGADPTAWEFRCPACGHVQSAKAILERNPQMTLDQAMQAVYFACEGRINPRVGCKWISSNPKKIHTIEVVGVKPEAPHLSTPVFWFAKDPVPMQWHFINLNQSVRNN